MLKKLLLSIVFISSAGYACQGPEQIKTYLDTLPKDLVNYLEPFRINAEICLILEDSQNLDEILFKIAGLSLQPINKHFFVDPKFADWLLDVLYKKYKLSPFDITLKAQDLKVYWENFEKTECYGWGGLKKWRDEIWPLQIRLIRAALAKDLNTLKTLLEVLKVNPNCCNNQGQTPLMLAISSNADKQLIECLLANGANINAQDCKGKTALMYSTEFDTKLIELLISKGANIDAQDDEGNTALMHAACNIYNDSLTAIKLLLDKGANAKLQNNCDLNVLQMLMSEPYTYHELIEVLKKACI